MNDLKKLLLTRAHRIQASFESASDALAAKQHWFTVHYDLLTPAAITSTMEDIQNRIRGLKLYEMRLIRHRDLSGPRLEYHCLFSVRIILNFVFSDTRLFRTTWRITNPNTNIYIHLIYFADNLLPNTEKLYNVFIYNIR